MLLVVGYVILGWYFYTNAQNCLGYAQMKIPTQCVQAGPETLSLLNSQELLQLVMIQASHLE